MDGVVAWDGAAVRALRHALRLTQERLAERLQVDPRTVRGWERSEHAPTPALQQGLDALFAGADPEERARFDVLLIAADAGHQRQPQADDTEREGDDADRRTVLRAGLAGAGVLATGGIGEQLADQAHRRVDAGLVAAHRDLAAMLVGAYRTARPDVLVQVVAREADVLLGLLEHPGRDRDRHALSTLAIDLHIQAGLLTFHIGNRVGARRWFAIGRDIADDRTDDTLTARVLGASSILPSSLPRGGHGGDTPRAVALLRAAVERARRADGHTRAWLHRWLAMESAAAGDHRSFHHNLEEAEAATGRGHAPNGFFGPDGPFAPSDAETASTTGLGLLRLGHPDHAVQQFDRSLRLRPTQLTTRRIVPLADIAAACLLTDDVDQACATLSEALHLSAQAGYAAGLERVRGIRAGFNPVWSNHTAVRDLDERLHAA